MYEKTFRLSSHTPRYNLMSCPGRSTQCNKDVKDDKMLSKLLIKRNTI